MLQEKVVLNWSSGKDCALALYNLQEDNNYKVEKLLTTLNHSNKRIAMHGVHRDLLLKQVEAIDLPIELLYLEENIGMEAYAEKMNLQLEAFKKEDIYTLAFGDILLEDLKVYREKQLSTVGMQALFPLWKIDTRQIIERFINLGFKAMVVAASSEHFDKDFLGTEINESFLSKLPKGVDPCGENGEFHTFCYDGPIFKKKLNFSKGEVKEHEYYNPKGEGSIIFYFLELLKV